VGEILPSSQAAWLLGYFEALAARRWAPALGLLRPTYAPAECEGMLLELAARLHLRGPRGEPDAEAASAQLLLRHSSDRNQVTRGKP